MRRHVFTRSTFILLAFALAACSAAPGFPHGDLKTLEATYLPALPTPSSTGTPIPPTFTLAPRVSSTARGTPIPTSTHAPTLVPLPVIAFVSNSKGVNDIYALDGRSNRVDWICCSGYVQFVGSNAGDPAWSFDGRQLALVSDKSGLDQILLFNDKGIGSPGMGFVSLSDGTGNDREPAWSPDSSQIVFVSDRSGDDDLLIMNADGSGVHSLTQGPALDGSPAWSPDGRWIAFASTRSGGSDLYRITPDGGEPLRLTDHPALDGAPAWSPDAKEIAFMSQREGGNWQIYVLEVESGEVRRLTDHPAADQYPSWSGEQIAFMSARDGNFEIYTMNVDGSVQTRLTSTEGLDGYPVWSSPLGAPALASPTAFSGPTSGERIVFSSDRDGADTALWVMAADGSQQTRLDYAPNLDEQGVQQPYSEGGAQWSPNGKQIVFISDRQGGGQLFSDYLWVTNADGTGLRILPASGESPVWAPDNLRIAYEIIGVHEIYSVATVYTDGTYGPTLFENLDVRDPSGAEAVMLWYLYGGLDWSPDGQRIAFIAEGLWTAKVDGSDARLVVEDGTSPAWSPDGTKIAFMRGCGIWVVNANGSGERQVFDEPGCEMDPGAVPIHLCPTWAPDGRRLALDSSMDGDKEIYSINLDGSGLTQLTRNDAYDGCPDWSWR